MDDWRDSTQPVGLDLYRKLPKSLLKEFQEVRHLTQKFLDEFLVSHLKTSELNLETQPERLDHELLQALNERGFFSMWLPRFIGGRGCHPLSMTVFNELVAQHCLGVANIVGAHYFGFGLLALSHNYKIMTRITRDIRLGERNKNPCLLSAAVTEPTAGTDREDLRLLKKAKISCRATKTGDAYLLQGQKIYISNAAWARYHIVVTTSQWEQPEKETVILVVPQSTKGLQVSPPMRKWGQNACPASEISFQDCLISSENIALSRDDFPSDSEFSEYSRLVTDHLLAQSRAGVASLASGVCLSALKVAEDTVNVSLSKNEEWIQSKVAGLMRNAMHARLMAWEASLASQSFGVQGKTLQSWFFNFQKKAPQFLLSLLGKCMQTAGFSQSVRKQVLSQNANYALGLSSLAKFSTTDLCADSLNLTLEIVGPGSLTRNQNDLFKKIRDAKLMQIYEGTNQLNRIQAWYGLTKTQEASVFEANEKRVSMTLPLRESVTIEKIQLMRQAFDICFEYGKNRVQGGALLLDWSEHRQIMAGLQIQLETVEYLAQKSQSERETVRLMIQTDQILMPHMSTCMQLMGGRGYLYESGLPELFQKALQLKSQNEPMEKLNLGFWGAFH